MGSIGLFEVLLILIVSLLILGPSKLLTSIRYLGLMVRKTRILWSNISDEFDRQLRLDEVIKVNSASPTKNKDKKLKKKNLPSSASKLS